MRPSPYLPLTTPARYDHLVRLGWRLGAAPPVPLDEPIDWEEPGAELRSWFYHLQALDPIEPALAQWSSTGDREALALATSVALDWAGAHAERTDPQAWPRVWYDMATGLRAYRLSYLLGEARRAEMIDGESETLLLRLLQRHLELLVDPDGFTAHSNHGFFQSAGLLALCRRILRVQDRDAGVAVATERLRTILETHFTADGVHREHSPDYHLAVLEGFKALIRAELLADDAMVEGIARAERALSWFVKPDGRLVNFGDSDNRLLPAAIMEDLRPLKAGMRAFAEGGYAVVRANGDKGATYFAQTLCFHSRTHKQADDLSLIWTDRGRDILIDAGRYAYGPKTEPGSPKWKQGFWYLDPIRMFVESTAAHNTVEIDSQSQDRLRPAYGSALKAAGELGGVRYVLGHVDHGHTRHSRLVLIAPGQWLCLIDGLRSSGPLAHHYRQWFHFAPEWTVDPQENGFTARSGEGSAGLLITTLSGGSAHGPDVGRTKPSRQGWWSPAANKLEPAAAIAFSKRARSTTFATLLAFDDQGDVSGFARMNPDLHGEIGLDIGRKRIRIRRDREDLEIAFRSQSA